MLLTAIRKTFLKAPENDLTNLSATSTYSELHLVNILLITRLRHESVQPQHTTRRLWKTHVSQLPLASETQLEAELLLGQEGAGLSSPACPVGQLLLLLLLGTEKPQDETQSRAITLDTRISLLLCLRMC